MVSGSLVFAATMEHHEAAVFSSTGEKKVSSSPDEPEIEDIDDSVYSAADTGGSVWQANLEKDAREEREAPAKANARRMAEMRRQEARLALKEQHRSIRDHAEQSLLRELRSEHGSIASHAHQSLLRRESEPHDKQAVDDLVRTQWWGHLDHARQQAVATGNGEAGIAKYDELGPKTAGVDSTQGEDGDIERSNTPSSDDGSMGDDGGSLRQGVAASFLEVSQDEQHADVKVNAADWDITLPFNVWLKQETARKALLGKTNKKSTLPKP